MSAVGSWMFQEVLKACSNVQGRTGSPLLSLKILNCSGMARPGGLLDMQHILGALGKLHPPHGVPQVCPSA